MVIEFQVNDTTDIGRQFKRALLEEHHAFPPERRYYHAKVQDDVLTSARLSIFIRFALRVAKVVGSEKNDPEGRFPLDSLLKRFDESFRLPVVVLKNVRVQP